MATTVVISQNENKSCCRLCPKFSYAVMLLGVVALAATGIFTFIFGTPPMTEWILMIHVGASPLFSIGLALVALSWPGRSDQTCISKLLLWLILLCGLLVILTGVVPMTPIFGTPGQHLLYLTHRYSAIVLAVLVVLHLISLARKKA